MSGEIQADAVDAEAVVIVQQEVAGELVDL
jgi:hypothetical protein